MLKNAIWIKAPENTDKACYEFYTEFKPKKTIKSAILSISAMGMYRAFINGNRVGNETFTPCWTAYTEKKKLYMAEITYTQSVIR